MDAKNVKPLKPTIRALELGESCDFPIIRKTSVQVTCTTLEIENPGTDYTTTLDRENGKIIVTRRV